MRLSPSACMLASVLCCSEWVVEARAQIQASFGTGSWNFSRGPEADSTHHLVFDTANSFLQHWPNTRYRNGHNIVPGTVAPGTLLYHGTYRNVTPPYPEWTATDPEHSMLFCAALIPDKGCWHLTMVVTRPLKILYFDGSSAAKMSGGPLDTQNLVAWDNVSPENVGGERQRIDDLCKWGKRFGLDGFARMEMDFEIMLCDFASGVKEYSFLEVRPLQRWTHPVPPPQPPTGIPTTDLPRRSPTPHDVVAPGIGLSGHGFRVLEAGGWHNRFPGETRIVLDYSRIVSFYDVDLFPSLVPARRGQDRWDHRLNETTLSDWLRAKSLLEEVLKHDSKASSWVDWKTLLGVVTDRYAERLEVLRHILGSNSTTNVELISRGWRHVAGMVSPYNLQSAIPRKDLSTDASYGSTSGYPFEWAIPVWDQCSSTHVGFMYEPNFSSRLTPSEVLLADAISGVSKEICRVTVKIWAEGVSLGFTPEVSERYALLNDDRLVKVLERWQEDVQGLMKWLDWSLWVKCDPACAYEEWCYLPTWPYFYFDGSKPRRPPKDQMDRIILQVLRSRESVPGDLLMGLGDLNEAKPLDIPDWVRPQPKCIRRVEPF